MAYKFFPHTADVKFQAEGRSLEEMFSEAGMALKEVIAEGVEVKSGIKKKIEVSGKDLENLLYNFLEEFLFLLDAEDFLVEKIENLTTAMHEFRKDSINLITGADSKSKEEIDKMVKEIIEGL